MGLELEEVSDGYRVMTDEPHPTFLAHVKCRELVESSSPFVDDTNRGNRLSEYHALPPDQWMIRSAGGPLSAGTLRQIFRLLPESVPHLKHNGKHGLEAGLVPVP